MEPEEMITKYEKYLDLVKDISICYKRAQDELDSPSKLVVEFDNKFKVEETLTKDKTC
jgi:hypothetical protein